MVKLSLILYEFFDAIVGQPGIWMPPPAPMLGVPQGLEYLTQIDQLVVCQQVELLECKYISTCFVIVDS